MPIEWRKVSNREVVSDTPRGFTIVLTRLTTGDLEYACTWTGQPHKPSIGVIIVSDAYDVDKKRAAVSELKAACEAFVEANAIPLR